MFELLSDPATHPGWPLHAGPLLVRAGKVTLRPPRRRDARAWSRLRLDDRAYLERWEPTGEGEWGDRNSVAAWRAVRANQVRGARYGGLIPAVIELDGRVCGQLTVGGIARGSLCSAWVGYWVGSHAAGGGVASAAVALAVDHCFTAAGLHRVEATVRPENTASRVVLERCGFREEGLLRRYLHVDGGWRDHLLVAKTREEQGAGAVERLRADGVVRPA